MNKHDHDNLISMDEIKKKKRGPKPKYKQTKARVPIMITPEAKAYFESLGELGDIFDDVYWHKGAKEVFKKLYTDIKDRIEREKEREKFELVELELKQKEKDLEQAKLLTAKEREKMLSYLIETHDPRLDFCFQDLKENYSLDEE